MAEYRFAYQSVSESEEIMLDDLEAVLRKHQIEASLHHRFVLAVSEAFTNALVHGNAYDPKKEIRMRLEVNEFEVTADISDEGRDGLARVGRKKPPALLAEGGRGIDLIRHYASRVEFSETDSGGLNVTIGMTWDKTTNSHIRSTHGG